AGDGLIEVGQHAVVVVSGERDVLQAAAVEPGGELVCPPTESDLLVLLAPEREQRTSQVGDEGVCGQLRELAVKVEACSVVASAIEIRPGSRIGLRGLDPAPDVRVEISVVADDGKSSGDDRVCSAGKARDPRGG